MNDDQISAFIPIFCGLYLLVLALSTRPQVKPVKPTLGILAVSGLVVGVIVFMLADQNFRGYVGKRIAVYLYRSDFMFAGIGIGAVVTSLLYRHWTSAWLTAKQSQRMNNARNKVD